MALDKESVRDALSVREYVEYLGIQLRRVGNSLRGACPLCGGSKRATKFSITGERWHCYGCGESGDVFALAQLMERCDFSSAVKQIAGIAGVAPTVEYDESERKRRQQVRAMKERDKQKRQLRERQQAETSAGAVWEHLALESESGRRYRAKRGIWGLHGEVRFGKNSVCLPLRQTDGRITNVVGRYIDDRSPKIRGLKGCGTLGMFGDFRKLDVTTGPVMLTEGLADWCSARLLWTERLILGAHGGHRMADITRMIAAQLKKRGRALMFVAHRDNAGKRATKAALEAARSEGLLDENLFVYWVQGNDLNDELREP